MTDHELLKCAAEAMHNLKDPNFCNYSVVDGKVGVCLDLGSHRGAITSYWNPLTDDADALRLAVKLNLRVMPQEKCVYVESNPDSVLGFASVSEMEMNGDHPYAATRRAIVRAAAGIGKQIKGGQHGDAKP